jgi:hypothetical protein
LLLVPFASDAALFAHSSHTGTRYLVVSRTPAKALEGKILELLLRRTVAPLDTAALVADLYHTSHTSQAGHRPAAVPGEGLVLLYSADYQYLMGQRFRDGHWLASPTHLVFQRRPGTSPEARATPRRLAAAGGMAPAITAMPDVSACTDWYSGSTGEYLTTTGDCSGGWDGSDYVPRTPAPARAAPVAMALLPRRVVGVHQPPQRWKS